MGAAESIGIGTSVLGVGLSALGGVTQSRAAKRAARQANRDAKFIEKLGAREAEQILRQGDRFVGEQAVAYAGSGIDVTAGTPLDLMAETIAASELEALRTIAARQQEADSLRERGQAALQIGQSNALGTVLGGVSQGLNSAAMFARGR